MSDPDGRNRIEKHVDPKRQVRFPGDLNNATGEGGDNFSTHVLEIGRIRFIGKQNPVYPTSFQFPGIRNGPVDNLVQGAC
jgi:hypothetical protein